MRLFAAIACAAISLQAHALSIDLRGEYLTGSENFQSRVLVAHTLVNGLGGSMEYVMNNTSQAGAGVNEVDWDYTEYGLWYEYKLNESHILMPSLWLDVYADKGNVYGIGLQDTWHFAPTWLLETRLRLEYEAYETKDQAGKMAHDNTTRFELWLHKSLHEHWDSYYYFRWDYKLNDYLYNNGNPNYVENNIGLIYKAGNNFSPYAEVGYLGDTANSQQDPQWRIRLGAKYSF